MTISDSLRRALRVFRDAKTPLRHKCAENPEGLHHKTIEGLASRFLIKRRGDGWAITEGGLAALERPR